MSCAVLLIVAGTPKKEQLTSTRVDEYCSRTESKVNINIPGREKKLDSLSIDYNAKKKMKRAVENLYIP